MAKRKGLIDRAIGAIQADRVVLKAKYETEDKMLTMAMAKLDANRPKHTKPSKQPVLPGSITQV